MPCEQLIAAPGRVTRGRARKRGAGRDMATPPCGITCHSSNRCGKAWFFQLETRVRMARTRIRAVGTEVHPTAAFAAPLRARARLLYACRQGELAYRNSLSRRAYAQA